MAAKKFNPAAKVAHLLGEGSPVEVRITNVVDNPLGDSTNFNIDLLQAEAPARKFVADGFSLIELPAMVRLLFVQTKIDGQTPRALLDIHVANHAIENFVNVVLNNMPEEIPNMPEPFVIKEEPTQTVALAANFFRASVSPPATCLDFFYASPFSMQAMVSQKAIHVEGVVRVQMSDTVFISFVKNLRMVKILKAAGT